MELSTIHLLQIDDLSRSDINNILLLAKKFKALSIEGENCFSSLIGKVVINLFYEPSTRTRVSFEIAAKRLGASVVNIQSASSSAQKGESLLDTARNLASMNPDLFIIRHPESGAPNILTNELSIPIINAGDGSHEHPSQALLDAMTLMEQWESLEGKRVLIVGDIKHSRVARSNLSLLPRLGAEVIFSGPEKLVPEEFRELGATIEKDFEKALKSADAVMMLRMQAERWGDNKYWEEIKNYSLTKQRMKHISSNAFILHPGPINRGVEMETEIADGRSSLVLKQVANGVFLRMALLHLLGKGKPL